ncbi:hypothetical protein ACIQAA_08795 [Neobacillus sp. NPDC093182]|uniref:hypothetical protein n=1 Tax=Neobacillus sp. NPDC093182 TaxID=3364297 RepID=UPI00380C3EAC
MAINTIKLYELSEWWGIRTGQGEKSKELSECTRLKKYSLDQFNMKNSGYGPRANT